ncbi:prepilin-type N-terminal cleavage/methylation domain-containing protein [Patescibacteria group bacterium]|nr:prepilin-type N-terminal cleavage/methylation domain-containing protein [Patescibacteria group bacterium]
MINNKGQTLIELIIYISILSVVLLIVTLILFNLVQTQNIIITTANANDTTRYVLHDITGYIEDGYMTTEPNPQNATSSILTVQTDSSGDKISFYTKNGIIYSQYNDSTPIQLSSSNIYIYNMTFYEEATSGTSPTIEINLSETNTLSTGVKTTKTYETTATQRRQ